LQSDGLLDKAGRLLGTMMISYFRWESEMKAQHRMGFTVCTRCHSFVMRQHYADPAEFPSFDEEPSIPPSPTVYGYISTSVDVAFV
jgi:hypothetical protein